MTLESFYLICFLVGFLLSLVSFLAQSTHIHVPGGHDGSHVHSGFVHTGHAHGGHCHGHAAAGHATQGAPVKGTMSKLNFSTLTAFLAWFGGSGYLLQRYTSLWTLFGLAIAAASGLAGAGAVFWFLAKLMERDRTLDPADFDMIGVLGRVSCTVYQGGTGELIFVQNGIRRSSPARSEDGAEIPKGEEVVVTKYERGVSYVRRWSDLAGMTSGQ